MIMGISVGGGGGLVGGGAGVFVGGSDVSVAVGGNVLVKVGWRMFVDVGGSANVLVLMKVKVGKDCDDGELFPDCCGKAMREGVPTAVGTEVSLSVLFEPSRPSAAMRVATASSGLTGVICCCEQKLPVMVQASVNSSGESGWG